MRHTDRSTMLPLTRGAPRVRPIAAALSLLVAACAGGSGDDMPSSGCTIAYAGGANETVWCDAPVVRSNGSGGYVLWVMASRGPQGLGADQAGQVTVVLDTRPEVGVDYGFGADAVGGVAVTGFETRTAGGETTHEARTVGGLGSFSVRFSSIPASDGADPGGWDGIGTVHGTFTARLAPLSAGADVTAAGTF